MNNDSTTPEATSPVSPAPEAAQANLDSALGIPQAPRTTEVPDPTRDPQGNLAYREAGLARVTETMNEAMGSPAGSDPLNPPEVTPESPAASAVRLVPEMANAVKEEAQELVAATPRPVKTAIKATVPLAAALVLGSSAPAEAPQTVVPEASSTSISNEATLSPEQQQFSTALDQHTEAGLGTVTIDVPPAPLPPIESVQLPTEALETTPAADSAVPPES